MTNMRLRDDKVAWISIITRSLPPSLPTAQFKESSKKQKLIKYNLNNFKDYFAVKNQKLVVKPDGKFIAIDNKVYKQLEKEGKVEGNYWVSKESPPADGTVDFIPAGSRNDGPTPDFSTN